MLGQLHCLGNGKMTKLVGEVRAAEVVYLALSLLTVSHSTFEWVLWSRWVDCYVGDEILASTAVICASSNTLSYVCRPL